MEEKSKGFVLIAMGSPYYARMSYNLALSIRYHTTTPITIIKSGGSLAHLFDWQQEIFDNIIEVDLNKIKRNGNVEYLKTKTLLYDLSPYDKTIFFDADTICSPYKNPDELFNNEGLLFANRGEKTPADKLTSDFADIGQLFSHYGFKHWYDLSSEFIFFEKSEANKKFFDDASHYYDDDSIPVITFNEKNKEQKKGITMFNGGKPDEVPFGIAIEKNNIRFQSPFLPSYWQPQYFTKMFTDDYVKKNFYLISAGGAQVQSNIKRIFYDLIRFYYSHMKINLVPIKLESKASYMAERKWI